jgi:hypothetical protein
MLNPDGCVGNSRLNANDVNINRNFDWHWDENPNSCPHSECGGTAAWSEIETRVFRDWVNSEDYDMVIDVHGPSDQVVPFHSSTYCQAANTSMAADKLAPFIQTSGSYFTTSGMLGGWVDNVAGVLNTWVLETEQLTTAFDFAEESNRIISHLHYYAGEMDSLGSDALPWFDTNPYSQLPFAVKPFNQ